MENQQQKIPMQLAMHSKTNELKTDKQRKGTWELCEWCR